MAYVQKQLTAAATTGYIISLGKKCGKISISSTGTAAFKVGSGTPPATPTNAYVPGAGLQADTVYLSANTPIGIGSDIDGRGQQEGLQDPIEWVAVWSIGGGTITVIGH